MKPRGNKLIELTFASETPVLLGGYDTQWERNFDGIRSSEGLRAQSLKGMWRWWARAYLAGAMWDKHKRIDMGTLRKIIDELFGSAAEGGHASKLRLVVTDVSHSTGVVSAGRPREYFLDRLSRIARIKLLTLKGEGVTFARELTANVAVYLRRGAKWEEDESTFAVGALLTGVALSGIGKAARRGFGCFDVRIRSDLTGRFSRLKGGWPRSIEGSKTELRNLIEQTLAAAKELISEEKMWGEGGKYPPIPSLAPSRSDELNPFELYVAGEPSKKPLDLLNIVNDFTTRPLRLRRLSKRFTEADPIIRRRVDWVLGLPRTQKGTGYIPEQDFVSRRASPFVFAVHSSWLSASLFVSKDWPRRIRWVGGKPKHRTTRSIDTSAQLEDAYIAVRDELINYLKLCGLEWTKVF